MLLQEGFVTSEQIAKAHARQKANGHKLGYNLIELGFVESATITMMLERQFRVRGVDLGSLDVEPGVLKLIPVEIANKYEVFPVRRDGNAIVLAMGDPTDWTIIDDLKFLTGYEIEPVVADEFSIVEAIAAHYGTGEGSYRQLMENLGEYEMEVVEEVSDDEDYNVLAAQVEAAPVVKFINSLLADAVQRGASDIHIEPYEEELRIRYRIDGVLREMVSPPLRMKAALISRVKILADLNIAERRIPQDGRIKMKMGNRVIDFRVSTLPTLFGEKIVLRILDRGNLTLDLDKLGFPEKGLKDFHKAIEAPYGIVLVTGPTGSREDHDPVLGAHRAQPGGRQHHDRRRSGRIQPEGHQPGPDPGGDQHGLPGSPARLPAPGPEHHHGRRDPRPRDGIDRDQGRADGTPRAFDDPYQRRAVHGQPHGRHGAPAVPRGERAERHRGPAARAPDLRRLQAAAAVSRARCWAKRVSAATTWTRSTSKGKGAGRATIPATAAASVSTR